jgi:hypothetical protein
MRDLPTFITQQHAISINAYGNQRHPGAPIADVQSALARAHADPTGIYAWVDVILAGIEGGLRSGSTPFALCQALVNRQGEMGNTRYPPQLARQASMMDARAAEKEQAFRDEYGG